MGVGRVEEDAVCDSRRAVILVVANGHREELIFVGGGRVLVGECTVRTRRRRDDVVMRVHVVGLIAIPAVDASAGRRHRCGLLEGRKRRCRVDCLPGNLR